jgi:IclR family pca regulon transcriptional regulator
MVVSNHEPTAQPRQEGMAGLAKGLAILELLGARNARITVTTAAERTGITRAAARRCLLTLTSLSYLHHDGKFFTPAPRLLRLGSAYLGGDTLAAAAAPILDRLRDRFGESVSLAVAEDDEVLFIARSAAARVVSAAIKIGARWPLYCTATGRVLLAARPDAEIDAYLARHNFEKRTRWTVADAAGLRQVVERIRETGHAVSDEEVEIGLRAVAVPVRSPAGDVVASMAVSASSARMSIETMEREIVPALHDAAKMLVPR